MRHRARAAMLVATLVIGFAPTWARQSGSGYDSDYDYPGQGDDWYGRRDLSRPNRDYAPPLLDQVSIGEDFCLGYERLFDHLGRGAPLFRTQGRPFDFLFRFSAADPGFPCIGGANPCDDGNPCTMDAFDVALLRCVSTPVTDGTACPDGLFCNGPETCQSGACATGPPPVCDDANACTVDSCNPTFDVCVSVPMTVPGEAQGLMVALDPGTTTARLRWNAAPGADRYGLYRDTAGRLDALTCYQSGLPSTGTNDRGEVPVVGRAFFFLTTGTNCAGEGTLGGDSHHIERQNRNPCP